MVWTSGRERLEYDAAEQGASSLSSSLEANVGEVLPAVVLQSHGADPSVQERELQAARASAELFIPTARLIVDHRTLAGAPTPVGDSATTVSIISRLLLGQS